MVTWYWNLQCVPFVAAGTPKLSRDVPGDVDLLCNRAAVLGAPIQERPCSFLCTALPRMVKKTQILHSLNIALKSLAQSEKQMNFLMHFGMHKKVT